MSIANIAKFRLPGKATQEELECNWSKVIRFNDSIIVAGYYFMGRGKPSILLPSMTAPKTNLPASLFWNVPGYLMCSTKTTVTQSSMLSKQ